MSITRSPRRQTWTNINNEIINDPRIPIDTLGLFVYLLSKPDHWNINVSNLMTWAGAGRQKVYRMLQDLQACGYASYTKHNDGTTDWIISEDRMDTPYAENHHKPHDEKPDEENHHHIVNTERAVSTEKKPFDQTAFDAWWELYPKKVGKKHALAAWKKLRPDTQLVQTILADTRNRKENDRKWIEGFIKDPVRYIRHEQWDDEIDTRVAKATTSLPHDMAGLTAVAEKHNLHPKGHPPQTIRNVYEYRSWIEERM